MLLQRYIDAVLADHSENPFSLVPVSKSDDDDSNNFTVPKEELLRVPLVSKPGLGFMPSSVDLEKLNGIDRCGDLEVLCLCNH